MPDYSGFLAFQGGLNFAAYHLLKGSSGFLNQEAFGLGCWSPATLNDFDFGLGGLIFAGFTSFPCDSGCPYWNLGIAIGADPGSACRAITEFLDCQRNRADPCSFRARPIFKITDSGTVQHSVAKSLPYFQHLQSFLPVVATIAASTVVFTASMPAIERFGLDCNFDLHLAYCS